jgi:hypothetical protein
LDDVQAIPASVWLALKTPDTHAAIPGKTRLFQRPTFTRIRMFIWAGHRLDRASRIRKQFARSNIRALKKWGDRLPVVFEIWPELIYIVVDNRLRGGRKAWGETECLLKW